MRKILIGGIIFCCCTNAAQTFADTVYCVNCSENATQALERVTNLEQLQTLLKEYDEAIQQTAAQLEMVQQNIEQYANMVQNTVMLPANLINKISTKLTEAGRITAALNSMRADIQGLANVHDALYLTQDELSKLVNVPRDMMSQSTARYHTSWDNWSRRVDDATKATFQLSGKQLQDLEKSGELESYINELLSTPDGQQRALMAGNQLAALQIQEARQLRELLATKIQADMASQTKQEKEDQAGQEMHRKMLDGMDDIDTRSYPDPF